MLDGDLLTGYHHSLDEEPDKPLPPAEVECIEPFAYAGRKGSEVACQPLQPRLVRVLYSQLLGSCARCGQLAFQPFASRLQLRHFQSSLLVGFRDVKDLRFGMGLSSFRIAETDRR